MRKNTSIQICRGLAAIIVVFHHLFFMQFEKLLSKDSIFNFINYNLIGDFAVYVFFAISGYVMMLSISSRPKKPIQFILDRMTRIYPLYITWTIIALIITYFGSLIGIEILRVNYIPKTLSEFIRIVFLIPATSTHSYGMTLSPAWSLVYEMYYYFTLAFFLSIFGKEKIPFIITFYFLFSAIFISTVSNPPRESWVYLPYIIGDNVSLCFSFGALSYVYLTGKYHIPNPLHIALVMLSILSLLLMKGSISSKYTVIILACITFHSFSQLQLGHNHLTKCLSFLGDASYSIYITHILFSLVSWRAAMLDKNLLMSFIYSVLSIAVGISSYLLIEKPIARIIKKKMAHNSQ